VGLSPVPAATASTSSSTATTDPGASGLVPGAAATTSLGASSFGFGVVLGPGPHAATATSGPSGADSLYGGFGFGALPGGFFPAEGAPVVPGGAVDMHLQSAASCSQRGVEYRAAYVES
jgi:hypothetical protein